ncbi:choice-of-anchor tandem repeat NxxGxxAF-containing protein [Botrimarina sp.]|uniref:DUF7453 family protein n=1 Tax=Botrimarina sp. TaxID=2795802 RepID=UPI0032EDC126
MEAAYYGSFASDYALNADGMLAVTTSIKGLSGLRDDSVGVWLGDEGSLRLIAKVGDSAPGSLGGFYRTLPQVPSINPLGEVSFKGSYGYKDGGPYRNGLWIERDDALTLVVSDRDPVPGIEGAGFFNAADEFEVNARGDAVFNGSFSGEASGFGDGIWLALNGREEIVPVAVEGQLAPDADGAVFSAVGSSLPFGVPMISDQGDVLFLGSVLGGEEDDAGAFLGLWRYREGSLSLLARTDSPAPGIPGATFKTMGTPVLNRAGQAAFIARINRDDATTSGVGDGQGLWLAGSNNELRKLLVAGDIVDVESNPSLQDLRVIESIDVAGNGGASSGRPSPFNARGELGVRLTFTDGSSGVFIVNTIVPEPSTLVIGVVAILAASISSQPRVFRPGRTAGFVQQCEVGTSPPPNSA